MTTVSTDIMDEDAADLQFPKDDINVELADCPDNETSDSCDICRKSFGINPKILCAECPSVSICVECFRFGLETQTHRSDHSYRIDRRHVPLNPDDDWTPIEDAELLKNLQDFGYGNNIDLQKRLSRKTLEEVRRRVDILCGLDKAPLRACLEIANRPCIKYNHLAHVEEPPRFPMNSLAIRMIAGYNAPRGDFEIEHENNAEGIVSALDEDDIIDELDLALTCATINIYQEKLRERFRRKRIIRDHALLMRKYSICMHRYDPRMFVFMQLMNGYEYESLLVGFNSEDSLKSKFRRLVRYRKLGMKRHCATSIYDKLVKMRDGALKSMSHVQILSSVIPPSRKKAPPLDITSFPSFNTLTEGEQDLCAKIRILPEAYQGHKNILINESRMNGGIRLMVARQLIKIDVNKTRKIFNFLRDNEFIIEKKKD